MQLAHKQAKLKFKETSNDQQCRCHFTSELVIKYREIVSVYVWYLAGDMNSTSTNSDKLSTNERCSISYEKSLEYWADIPPTVDGVLGGFGFISKVDIDGSEKFLESLLTSKNAPSAGVALDCGAGIGRITKDLLTHHFEEVDIVEPDEKFITSIKQFVGELSTKIRNLYKVGLQEFIPVRKYDVIWNQWVLGYLTDVDLVSYLNRCK